METDAVRSRPFDGYVEVAVGSASDPGRVRPVNEDSVLAVPHVYVVADGMGGHAAGDRASAIVVDEMRSLADGPVDAATVTRVLDAANRKVRLLIGEGRGGAATTVSSVIGVDHEGIPYWLVTNLGDSRVYQLSDGEFRQVSVDHSVVQEMVDSGTLDPAAARAHPQRHIVTRAVGAPEALEPDYWLIPVVVGDRLVVCSDGLTTEVDDEGIRTVLLEQPRAQAASDALVARALESGGRDNVSVLVIDVVALRGAAAEAEHTVPRAGTVGACASDDTIPRQQVGAP